MTQPFQPKHFELLHELKNRIRIHIRILEKDPERTYIFEIILKKRPEIKSIKSVPEIGSVTLYFDHSALPKQNLLTILDMVLGNIGTKKISLPKSNTVEDLSVPLQDISLAIESMSCASCALLLEMSLKRDPRVHDATVNFASAIASVNGRLTQPDMAEIIRKLSYRANLMDTLSQRQELIRKEHQRLASAKKRFIWASVLSAPPPKVTGGCVNGTGVLTIKATAIGMDTVLAGIIHMVDHAQTSKLPVQKMVDKISAVFVPSVMGISALTFASWTQAGAPFSFAFSNAVTVLLIASPCALGLATPTAIMVGTGQSAKRGVYIRNGESLETATHLTAIIFDKTGTITEGKPQVTDFINISTLDDEVLLTHVASAENNSEHFLAQAIVNYVQGLHEFDFLTVADFNVTAGRGLHAKVGQHRTLIDNQAWLEEQGIDISELLPPIKTLGLAGKTPALIAVDGKASALFGIADQPHS